MAIQRSADGAFYVFISRGAVDLSEYTVPLDDGAALAWLYDHGEVLSRVDKGLRAHLRVGLDAADTARFERHRTASSTG